MNDARLSTALAEFETELDPAHPDGHVMPTSVLGYGEMSTVLAIDVPPLDEWACKRMALFESRHESDSYAELLSRYVEELSEVGLSTPRQEVVTAVSPRTGHPVLYLLQRRVDPHGFGNSLVKMLDADDAARVMRRILHEAGKVWDPATPGLRIGLDSQVSNWVLSRPPGSTSWDDADLLYMDTGTPLMRVDDQEQIDPELFLRTCPSSLVWVVRRFFLQDVLDRYYDFRSVAIDVVANLIKEGRPDLVGVGADVATDAVLERHPEASPITEKEVRSYYREDKLIWQLFLGLRRTERFVKSTLLRRPYDVVLPGRIER